MKRLFLALLFMTVVVVAPTDSFAQRGKAISKLVKSITKTRKPGKVVLPKASRVAAKGISSTATSNRSAMISRVAAIGGTRIANSLSQNGNIEYVDGNKYLLLPCNVCGRKGYVYYDGYYYLCSSCIGHGFLIFPQ